MSGIGTEKVTFCLILFLCTDLKKTEHVLNNRYIEDFSEDLSLAKDRKKLLMLFVNHFLFCQDEMFQRCFCCNLEEDPLKINGLKNTPARVKDGLGIPSQCRESSFLC